VADIPLLLEGKKAGTGTGAVLPFDVIALVYAREEQQLERVIARDGLAPQDARARIASQLPIEEKRALADVVIDNSGHWEAPAKQGRGPSDEGLGRARPGPPRRARTRSRARRAPRRRGPGPRRCARPARCRRSRRRPGARLARPARRSRRRSRHRPV